MSAAMEYAYSHRSGTKVRKKLKELKILVFRFDFCVQRYHDESGPESRLPPKNRGVKAFPVFPQKDR